MRLLLSRAGADSEFVAAFAQIGSRKAGALLVGSSSLFTSRRDRIVGLAAQYRMPAAYEWSEFVRAGGLMSYGSRLSDVYRQIGVYAGKIIKGAKPDRDSFEDAARCPDCRGICAGLRGEHLVRRRRTEGYAGRDSRTASEP